MNVDIKRCILDVLRDHAYLGNGMCTGDGCEWKGDHSEHVEHVAEVLIADLRDAVSEIPDLGRLDVFLDFDGYNSMREAKPGLVAEHIFGKTRHD